MRCQFFQFRFLFFREKDDIHLPQVITMWQNGNRYSHGYKDEQLARTGRLKCQYAQPATGQHGQHSGHICIVRRYLFYYRVTLKGCDFSDDLKLLKSSEFNEVFVIFLRMRQVEVYNNFTRVNMFSQENVAMRIFCNYWWKFYRSKVDSWVTENLQGNPISLHPWIAYIQGNPTNSNINYLATKAVRVKYLSFY